MPLALTMEQEPTAASKQRTVCPACEEKEESETYIFIALPIRGFHNIGTASKEQALFTMATGSGSWHNYSMHKLMIGELTIQAAS